MKTLGHIIKELFIDVEISGKTSSLAMGNEVADFCKAELVPSIAKQLERLAHDCDGEMDVLNIDIGHVDAMDWKVMIKEKFNRVLEERLTEINNATIKKDRVSRSIGSDSAVEILEEALDRQLYRFHSKEPVFDRVRNRNMPRVEKLGKAFVYFLERGCLPWWYPTDSTPDICTAYIAHLTREPALRLLPKLQRQRNARQRFLTQLPQSGVDSFLNLIGIPEKLLKSRSALYGIFAETITPRLQKMEFESISQEALITKHEVITVNSGKAEFHFLRQLLSHSKIRFESHIHRGEALLMQWNAFRFRINAFWPHIHLNKDHFEELLSFQDVPVDTGKKTEKEVAGAKGKESASNQQMKSAEERIPEDHGYKSDEDIPAITGLERIPLFETELREGVYVSYAGIVLLHPFLPALFEKLELLERGIWKNRQCQLKGVHLLAYLSTGKRYCPEYDGLLFKHLCGLPWETWVASDLELEPNDMKEAEAMLLSVLEHWSVLKNTSIDGLREGFIIRSGKLIKKQETWQLHVEQKSQDILLRQLPWGIGMIRFPWIKEMIWINWN